MNPEIQEFLSKCWIPGVYLKSRFYYAYGNTRMDDFLQDLSLPETVDILFLGSGDIRHTLNTIAGLGRRPEVNSASPKVTRFHLVDVDSEVIARNIVLLELIKRIDVSDMRDMTFLWEIWYNFSLTKSIYERLLALLREISSDMLAPVKDSSDCTWNVGNDETGDTVRKTIAGWIDGSPWNFYEVRESRKRLLQHYSSIDIDNDFDINQLCKLTFLSTNIPLYKDTRGTEMKSSDTVEFETGREQRLKDEIWKAELTGNATDPASEIERLFINPTLMRPGSNAWHVHYALNPFLCYLPLERPFLKLTTSLFRACLVELQSVLKDFKRSLETTWCLITVWISDAFYFLHQQLQSGILFDFIHTSNLSDHVGLLNLLVSCSPVLKNENSVIVTESFRWSMRHNTVQEYVRANVFCDPLLLPMILGVRLAEDFDLGTVTPPYSFFKVVGLPEAIFWMKCERSSNVAIGLDGSSDVKEFLETLVVNCYRQISDDYLYAQSWRVSLYAVDAYTRPIEHARLYRGRIF